MVGVMDCVPVMPVPLVTGGVALIPGVDVIVAWDVYGRVRVMPGVGVIDGKSVAGAVDVAGGVAVGVIPGVGVAS